RVAVQRLGALDHGRRDVDADRARARRAAREQPRRPAVAAAPVEDALAGLLLQAHLHLAHDVAVLVLHLGVATVGGPGVEGAGGGFVAHGAHQGTRTG